MAERLFTYGVFTAEVMRAVVAGELNDEEANVMLEEVDVHATSATEALKLAEAEALDLYGPGATLFPLAPGGSGGLVQIWH